MIRAVRAERWRSSAARLGKVELKMGPSVIYQLRVEEHLDAEMAAWFAPLQVVNEPDGVATLTGPVADQAALHGLVNKVFSLNLTLLAVNKIHSDRSLP